MKITKRILVVLALVAVLVCGFVISASAAEPITVSKNMSSFGFSNQQKVTSLKLDGEDGNITVAFSKATGSTDPAYYTSGTALRCYAKNTVTVSCSEGYNIISVKITYTSQSSGTFTYNGSNVATNTTVTVNAPSVTFAVGSSGQARITAMTVVYESTASGDESCKHENLTHSAAVDATCTKEGNKEYWQCANTDCGLYFSDSAKQNEIAEADIVISALGHDYRENTTDATCTEDGEKITTCSHCDYMDTEVIPAFGHKDDNDDKKCDNCGVKVKKEGSTGTETIVIKDYASANSWVNGTKYATITLDNGLTFAVTGSSNSGKYYTSGYEWRLYQTENAKFTITANDVDIVSVKITYNISNTGVLNNGTNITSGTVVDVNASSITFSVGNTGSATNGQVKITEIEVVYGEVTYVEDDSDCEHSYEEEVTQAPSCTDKGVKTFTCSECGDAYTEEIDALGHSYEEEVTQAPTCTDKGVKTFTCSECSDSYTEEIDAHGHSYDEEITITPTCTEAGEKNLTCSECGDTKTEEIPALGHKDEDGDSVCDNCPLIVITETESINIADYAGSNSWVDSKKYTSIVIDGFTITAAGGTNTGKYYTNGKNWRLYQGENATLTITADDGTIITSIKITYTSENTGTLTYNESNVASGIDVNVNASTITFGVGNTGSATNGQARITAIEISYAIYASASPDVSDEEKVEVESNTVTAPTKTEITANDSETLDTAPSLHDDIVISWSSDSEYAVITTVDGVTTVTYTLPEKNTADVTVTLTATIECGSFTMTKEYKVTLVTEFDIPEPNTVVSIVVANKYAATFSQSNYKGLFFVTGTVSRIDGSNMYIVDEAGNELYVYTVYNENGEKTMPEVGDTVKLCGELGMASSPRMRNAVLLTSNYKVKSANISISHDITMNFKLQLPVGANVKVSFIFNGKSYDAVAVYDEESGMYNVSFSGITPQYMNEKVNIVATVSFEGNNAKYAKTYSLSVLDYCNLIANSKSEDTALMTMLSDLLAYGAQAQIYTKTNVDNLVTAGITSDALRRTSTFEASNFSGVENDGLEDTPFGDATLVLGSSVAIRFNIKSDMEISVGGTLNVKASFIRDENEQILANGREYTVLADDEGLYVLVDNVRATSFASTVTIGDTAKYSVNTYVLTMYEDAKCGELVKALANYGASAYAYELSKLS